MDDAHLKQELEKRKEELTRTYQSNIAAIESTIIILDQRIASPKPPVDSTKLRDLILSAIAKAPQYFSLTDVENYLAANYPGHEFSKSSVASSFWKIVKEEFNYPMVTPGAGRKPTVYAKIK
jgi:hypothetical protein